MHAITFYFDFVSPCALLAFEAVPGQLQDCAYEMRYLPVDMAALGGADTAAVSAALPARQEWLRWCARLAHGDAGPPRFPTSHPGNSLSLLQLAIACSREGQVNRFTAETLFHHGWYSHRAEPVAADALKALEQAVEPLLDGRCPYGSRASKAQLQVNTEKARRAGVTGVPTWELQGQCYRGLDALPMLRQALQAGA